MRYKPRDVSSSNFLDREGVYHLCVDSVNTRVTKKGGALMDGVVADLEMTVLAGTTEGQMEKKHRERVWEPDLNVDWQVRSFDRLLLALGLITEGDLDNELDIDFSKAAGAQIVAKLTLDQKQQKYLSIHFGDVWHVDDPQRADCPLNEGSLRMMPANRRRIGGSQQSSDQWDDI